MRVPLARINGKDSYGRIIFNGAGSFDTRRPKLEVLRHDQFVDG